MSDILELGKAVNEKCQSKDGSVDHRYWAFRSVELLPALIAETERLRSANSHLHSICQKQQDTLDAYRHQNVDYYGKITAKDARIKELEAYIERLEAAFLEAKRCPTCNGKGFIRDPYLSRVRGLIIDESIDRICPMCEGKGEENAREELERIKEGGKDEN